MKTTHVLGLLICLSLSAFVNQPTVQAQNPPKKDDKAAAKAHDEAHLLKALEILVSTKAILDNADHDYGGHKAHAIRDIGAAEHKLRHTLGAKAAAVKAPAHEKKPGSQTASNGELSHSVKSLKDVIGNLNRGLEKENGERVELLRTLTTAFNQLETAVKFDKSKTAPAKK